MKILNRKTGIEREVTQSTWNRMVSTGQARYYKVVKEQPEQKVFQRIENFEETVVREPKRRRKAFDIEEDIN